MRTLRCFALAAALAGCNSGGGDPVPTPDPEPDPDPVPAAYGLGDDRVPFEGSAFPLDPVAPAQVMVELGFTHVSFRQPVSLIAAPDGSDRVVVVDRYGEIALLPNDDSVTTKTIFLDMTSKITTNGEDGLLGVAFDPDYATNGYFYVHYSAPPSGDARVSRFKVSSSDPDKADPASEVVLLNAAQPVPGHNGGMLAFGPDKKLYTSLGDGVSSGNGQDKTTLLGKILRIDPHGGTPYGIPSDNPFVGAGGGTRPEIWAYGFRNPWRFSFDRDTGDLWVGDVGEGGYEEVNRVEKGGNYGWNLFEGTTYFGGGSPPSGFKPPFHEFYRGCVIGGYVYRGNAIPGLFGAYVYGDHNSGNIYALRYSGNTVTSNQTIVQVGLVVGMGQDREGELYLLDYGGSIGRIKGGGVGGGPLLPNRLSSTGLFHDLLDMTPAPGLVEYAVSAELWSDGAVKRRWIGLPGTERIAFDAAGNWQFPVGTVIVKHFELPVSATSRVRLETRVLVHESDGWAGYTYKWNVLGSDATLLQDADSQTYTVDDPSAPGGTRQQVWNFPSRAQCLQCHTVAAGRVLGLRTHQINRDFDYPGGVTDNQLRAWNHVGLFDEDIGDALAYPSMPDPRDETAPQDLRARAYLEANCAQCHRAGSTTPGGLDLRYAATVGEMNVLDVVPSFGDLGLTDARRVKGGAKGSSVLWERMRRLDTTRMPPLGSGLVDGHAVTLVGEWIDGGP